MDSRLGYRVSCRVYHEMFPRLDLNHPERYYRDFRFGRFYTNLAQHMIVRDIIVNLIVPGSLGFSLLILGGS